MLKKNNCFRNTGSCKPLIVSFCKHHGNVTFQCPLNSLKLMVSTVVKNEHPAKIFQEKTFHEQGIK